jgi:NitT/TauT family transport system permease protein
MSGIAVRFIARWYSIPLLLLAWQLSVSLGLVHSRLLPGLDRVFAALGEGVADGSILFHTGVTMTRALTGFALACVIGVPFAALMARSRLFRNLFEPVFLFGYPIPKVALFPVFTYIFGIGSPSKIAFTFLECLYPIVVTTYFGFRAIPTRFIWTAQNFGAGGWTIASRVLLPAAMPAIFSGMRIALPVSIVVVILTEMIGDSVGLGYYITVWSTRFSFANVYAAVLVIAVCGFALDRALVFARDRALH